VLEQIVWLLILALPVACVSWTVTHEEILREPQEWLAKRSRDAGGWWRRKFFYMWTCEYCFSHYVAAGAIALTDYQLLLDDWRGYSIAWLALVAVANVYMSAYVRLRVGIRHERTEIETTQQRKELLAEETGRAAHRRHSGPSSAAPTSAVRGHDLRPDRRSSTEKPVPRGETQRG